MKHNALVAVENSMRDLYHETRAVLAKAEKRDGRLTDDEKRLVDRNMAALEGLKKERNSLESSGSVAERIRSASGNPDGWRELTKALAKGDNAFRGETGDFLGKAVTATDLSADSVIRRREIAELLRDARNIYEVFPTIDPKNALHAEEYKVSVATVSGTVERDPLATSAKATLAATIASIAADMKQFALILDGIPNALRDAEPQLEAVLRGEMLAELRKKLDDHAWNQLNAAGIATVSGGTTVLEKLRRAKSDLEANGVTPTVAIINSADFEAIENTPSDQLPNAFPFGLKILTHTKMASGDGVVFDPAGAVLYRGPAEFAADPYAGVSGDNFESNRFDLRAEFLGLLVVREAKKFISLQAGLLT